MTTTIEKKSSYLLKFMPIIGIIGVYVLNILDAVTGYNIIKIIVLVSIFSAILIVIEDSRDEKNPPTFFGYLLMLNFWFAMYPVYFVEKENKNNGESNFSFLAAILGLILIVGSGEFIRLGFSSAPDEKSSNTIALILSLMIAIITWVASVLISYILKTKKIKTIAIILIIVLALSTVTLVDQIGLGFSLVLRGLSGCLLLYANYLAFVKSE